MYVYVVTEEQVGCKPFPKFVFMNEEDAWEWCRKHPDDEVIVYAVHQVEFNPCVD